MPDHLKVCEKSVRAAGALLLDWSDRFTASEKGPKDLVTEADLASQKLLQERLLGAFPDYGFVGEEQIEGSSVQGKRRWIVDPLDGTMNYVHRLPNFCVSVALAEGNQILVGTVFDPVSEECFTAAAGEGAFVNGKQLRVSGVRSLENALISASFPPKVTRESREIDDFVDVLLSCQGVRRSGSAALNLCFVAAGRLDGYWATSTHSWDIAAGMLAVQEAGGLMTDLSGGPVDLDHPRFIAACSPEVHAQLMDVLAR